MSESDIKRIQSQMVRPLDRRRAAFSNLQRRARAIPDAEARRPRLGGRGSAGDIRACAPAGEHRQREGVAVCSRDESRERRSSKGRPAAADISRCSRKQEERRAVEPDRRRAGARAGSSVCEEGGRHARRAGQARAIDERGRARLRRDCGSARAVAGIGGNYTFARATAARGKLRSAATRARNEGKKCSILMKERFTHGSMASFRLKRRDRGHVAECPECAAMVAEARGFIAGSSRIVSALDSIPGNVLPFPAPLRLPGIRVPGFAQQLG